jgi:signal transduction histidine kinase
VRHRPGPGALAGRLHPRRQTLRLRLTLIYGALFLVSSVALLVVTYLTVDHGDVFLARATTTPGTAGGSSVYTWSGGGRLPVAPVGLSNLPRGGQLADLAQRALEQHASDLHELLVGSLVALGLMTLLSAALGWALAGRALRPLRQMTAKAQNISVHNLHERLGVAGPDDELKALAGTVDGLLSRLESAFAAQRHFVANASHELRTPLTLERAVLEVALADPAATVGSLRAACQKAVAAGEKHEHLVESLLTLATSERGIDRLRPVDLSEVAAGVLEARADRAASRGVQLVSSLQTAPVEGSAALLERLVANLVDNGLLYNFPGGTVQIVTGTPGDVPSMRVTNTGPMVPETDIDRLFQPFQRGGAGTDGAGLGLSITTAIARAHGALLSCRAGPHGGLSVDVSFPWSSGRRAASGLIPRPAGSRNLPSDPRGGQCPSNSRRARS